MTIIELHIYAMMIIIKQKTQLIDDYYKTKTQLIDDYYKKSTY